MECVLLAGLVALSLIPPLLYALYLRSREHTGREPLGAVLSAFLWGGTIGVAVAILLHVLFEFGYQQAGGPLNVKAPILAAVIIAPIVEELAKSLGLGRAKNRMVELEDGLIYGAALGLGFAATENLTYGVTALLDGGFGSAFGTIVVRTFSSMLLHASATALIGFGYGRMRIQGGVVWSLVPYYMTAVSLHALYNLLVGSQQFLGLVLGILMVTFTTSVLRKRIETLDALPHETWR